MLHPINILLEVWSLRILLYSQTQEYWPIILLLNKGIKNCKFRLKIKRGEDDVSVHWRNLGSVYHQCLEEISYVETMLLDSRTKTHFKFHTCLYEGSSQFPWVITIKWEVITVLHIAQLFQWSITIFQHNPQAHWSHWCICPTLVWVQKFFYSRNQILAFVQSTNSHFHLTIIAEPAISQVLLQQPKRQGGWSRRSQRNDCNNSCLTYAVWGYVVMLKNHTLQQIICWANEATLQRSPPINATVQPFWSRQLLGKAPSW